MTPKEKAKELVNMYIPHQSDDYPDSNENYHAKQCALLCVDEIAKELNKLESNNLGDLQYWTEVEYELNQL